MRKWICYNCIVEREVERLLFLRSLDWALPNLMRTGAGKTLVPFALKGHYMARDFAKPFYHSPEWQRIRQAVLMRDRYLCVRCGAPAEEVHHKTHLTPLNIGDPRITMNMDNLESLCKDCHFNEHRGEHGQGRKSKERDEEYPYEFDEFGNLVEKRGNDLSPRGSVKA